MSDFNDRPFVAGSLIGLRSFAVDSLGRLTGVTHREVFKPGENVGVCQKPDAPYGFDPTGAMLRPGRARAMYHYAFDITATAPGVAQIPARKVEKPEHKVGKLDCTCGFHAYFDGTNTYDGEGRLTGIVEGYGTVTVGTRGYRAEKARLVALVIPEPVTEEVEDDVPDFHSERWDKFSDYTSRHPVISSSVVVLGGMSALALLASAVTAFAVGDLVGVPLLAIAFALVALSVQTARAESHAIDRRYASVSDVSRCRDKQKRATGGSVTTHWSAMLYPGDASQPLHRDQIEAVRRNYADVPVYSTVKAALAAHPLTPPKREPITPETRDDFWTMEAPR